MSNVLSDIKWLNDVNIKEKLSSSVRGAGPRLPRSGHLSTIPWVFELWSIPSWQILADLGRFSDGATPSKQGAMQLHQLQLDIRCSEFHGCNLWCACTVWSVQSSHYRYCMDHCEVTMESRWSSMGLFYDILGYSEVGLLWGSYGHLWVSWILLVI